jgi:hypothetical protein
MEWVKLASLRSTWATLGITIAAAAGIAVLAAAGTKTPSADLVNSMMTGMFAGVLLAGVLGVLTVTSEYTSGTIRATLAAAPRRPLLLAAKAAVFGVTMLITGQAAAFLSFFAGSAALGHGIAAPALGQPAAQPYDRRLPAGLHRRRLAGRPHLPPRCGRLPPAGLGRHERARRLRRRRAAHRRLHPRLARRMTRGDRSLTGLSLMPPGGAPDGCSRPAFRGQAELAGEAGRGLRHGPNPVGRVPGGYSPVERQRAALAAGLDRARYRDGRRPGATAWLAIRRDRWLAVPASSENPALRSTTTRRAGWWRFPKG